MNIVATIGVKVLEVLFFAGAIGSAIVVLLTAIEDTGTMLGGGDDEEK